MDPLGASLGIANPASTVGGRNAPIRPITGPTALSQSTTIEGEDEQTALTRELEELRKWEQLERTRQDVARLRELKRKVLAGDRSALEEDNNRHSSTQRGESQSNLGAPRPKDPETFTTRDRLQYNCWVRDCEAIFRGAPSTFPSGTQKVDFAVRFLDETTRSTWDAYSQDHMRLEASWTPTWEELKAVMLDTLGPESLRRLTAHNGLKRAKQRPDQDPNSLLAHLNTLWSELGDYPEEQRRMDFMSALLSDIQKELLLRDQEDYNTVSKLNTLARYYWSKMKRTTTLPEHPARREKSRGHQAQDSLSGSSQTRKKAKKSGSAKSNSKPAKRDQDGPKDPNTACWGCNETGHFQRDCPKSKEDPKGSSGQGSGKGSGRRS